jgi:hypothetical protein
MSKLKIIVAAVAVSLSTACASHPSVYEDRSTSAQRDIRATGAAAVEAAKSNTSQNADIKASRGVSYTVYDSEGRRDYAAEARLRRDRLNGTYSGYAAERFSQEFDWRMKHKINTKIRNRMQELFD